MGFLHTHVCVSRTFVRTLLDLNCMHADGGFPEIPFSAGGGKGTGWDVLRRSSLTAGKSGLDGCIWHARCLLQRIHGSNNDFVLKQADSSERQAFHTGQLPALRQLLRRVCGAASAQSGLGPWASTLGRYLKSMNRTLESCAVRTQTGAIQRMGIKAGGGAKERGVVMGERRPAVDFGEMRRILAATPGPDLDAATAAWTRQAQLVKPAGALGRLEELSVWLATWQGTPAPVVRRPRIAVFAANHGVAARAVSAYPASATAEMVRTFQAGGGAINQICQTVDADLRVFELDLETPTRDFTETEAMDEEGCCRAMAYGMMAVEMGIHALCLGEMGIGNTTSAAALSCALFGGDAADWVDVGSGLGSPADVPEAELLERKLQVVRAGVARHGGTERDAFELLSALGGYEFAAIVGAILAARMARTPVILDGFACTAAAAVLFKLDPRALDHCLVAHRAAEAGHRRLLQILDKTPLFDFDLRMGEGVGAALAIPVLRAAATCLTGMATFPEAGVSRLAR